jgi:signal transduction histidine kinase
LHRRVPAGTADDEIAELAATMNRMLERLEAGQVRMQRFVSDASHELRSPVAAIRQHVEVALAHPDRTSLEALAETVHAENLRVQQLIDDLLLLANSDERAPAPSSPVDLDDLVFAEAARLRSTTLLRIDISGVSAGRVLGDPRALSRVLRNLGDNAARHAAGRIAFSLAEHNGHVLASVEDDGPGIPPEQRERVFERFVRLDEGRARDDGGAGLGLSIVAQLVALHRGSVQVAPAPSGGARFELRFPRHDG